MITLPPRFFGRAVTAATVLRRPTSADRGKLRVVLHDAVHPIVTPRLLDRLGNEFGKVAVCVVGQHAVWYTDLVKACGLAGCPLVFHGYSHRSRLTLDRWQLMDEFHRSCEDVKIALGQPITPSTPLRLRNPFDSWTPPGGARFGTGWFTRATGMPLRGGTVYVSEFGANRLTYRRKVLLPITERLRRDGGGEVVLHASRVRYRNGSPQFTRPEGVEWIPEAVEELIRLAGRMRLEFVR